MKSRRRVLLRTGWALLAGGAVLGAYAHWGLLPTQALRERAFERIERWTGKRVFFTKAVWFPGAGLALDDFRAAAPDGGVLLAVKRLRVDVRVLPFFLHKKIVIRNLVLETPVFDWSSSERPRIAAPAARTQISGQIPVPVVSAARTLSLESLKAEGADALLPENVYLEQVEIRRGFLRFREPDGSLRETIEIAGLKMAYRKPPVVDIDGDIRVGSPVYATLSIHGGWNLEKAGYDFFLQLQSERVPEWFDAYQQRHILILREGRTELAARLESITEARAAFHAKARLSDAVIRAAHASVRGRAGFEARGVFDFDRQAFERYRGTLSLEAADLENLSPQFPKIERVDGRVGFEPDLVTVESLRGRWRDLDFEAKGTIRSFRDLRLDGEIRSRLDLNRALALIPPEQKKLLVGFRLGGDCDALTTLKGSLKNQSALESEYRLVIERGFLVSDERRLKLDDLSSELSMGAKGLRIRNTRFRSGKTFYAMEASIPKKPASRGALSLSTDAWKLRAEYDVQGNDLRVRSGHAEGYGAAVAFGGMVRNVQAPVLSLKGSVRADLAKLESSAPAPLSGALKGVNMKGILSGPFELSGPWNRPKLWDLKVDASSARVTLKQWCRLDRFEMQVRARSGVIDVPYIRALPYGGSLNARYRVDLNASPAAFGMRLSGTNLDLPAIARDLLSPRQDQEIGGRLLFQLEMGGPLHQVDAWRGNGNVSVSGGRLWKTDRFKDMGRLPFVLVEGMDEVMFRQLRGSFDVHNRKIRTDDLSIYGDNVNLFLKGTIGFDQRLDMGMRIRYSEDVLEGALDVGGIVPFVVSEANAMISDYRVRGTVSAPVIEKSFLPVNPVGTVGKKVNSLTRALSN